MERWEISGFDDRRAVPSKLLVRAKVPRRFWTANLQAMPAGEAKDRYVDYLRDLDGRLQAGTGLLFTGPFGTGKTASACLVLIDVLARSSNRVLFVQTAEIDWYARHRNEDDVSGGSHWDVLVGAPFVVIDDVGAERDVNWNHAWFEEVVRARYNNLLPTIMTTNSDEETLFKKHPWLDGVLRDSAERIHLSKEFR